MIRNKSRKTNLLVILACVSTLFCCQEKKQYTYYRDGKIESVTELRNGVFDGERRSFYPSGRIKSIEHLSAGKLNGIVEYFYENGHLKSRANWIGGTEFGKGVAYYESGRKLFEAEYDSGKIQGYSTVYFESGQVKERKLYDALGELCYIVQFDENGKLLDSFVVPTIKANRDTIAVQDECLIKISYGLKLTGKIKIVAMQVDTAGNIERDKYIFESEGGETIIYRHTFSSSGVYKMVFKFTHSGQASGDTLSINGVESNCRVVVLDEDPVKS